MIKTIIFDIGGVVVPNLNLKIKQKIKNKNLIKKIYKYEDALNSGKITIDKLQRQFKNELGDLNLKMIFMEAALESRLNNKVKNIILKLNKDYKVVYLSNTIKEHYIARRKQHVYDLFSYGINSYKVKLKKPDLKIYKLLLKRLNARAEECLFIDDKLENIKSAKTLGIKTILFKNPGQLIKDLIKFNIKI